MPTSNRRLTLDTQWRTDTELLVHREEVVEIPSFDDLSIDDTHDARAFKDDVSSRRSKAQAPSGVNPGHSVVQYDRIALDDAPQHFDVDIWKGLTEIAVERTKGGWASHALAS